MGRQMGELPDSGGSFFIRSRARKAAAIIDFNRSSRIFRFTR